MELGWTVEPAQSHTLATKFYEGLVSDMVVVVMMVVVWRKWYTAKVTHWRVNSTNTESIVK